MVVTHSDPLVLCVCVCGLCDLEPPGVIDQTVVDDGHTQLAVCVCVLWEGDEGN